MFRKSAYSGYIEYNHVTKRKYFFNKETNDYYRYKDIVEKNLLYEEDNPRDVISKYNRAKNEIQRLSQNYPIQGSSADITKYAGILFMREILKRDWFMKVKIVNFVHDEILVEAPKDIAEEVKDILVNCMEEAGKPFCKILPLRAEALIGDHWVH